MSMPSPTTVILANRPRLFRELLHHALKTVVGNFNIIEVSDGLPSGKIIRDAHWLIVDADMTNDATKLAAANPNLRVLALDGRGNQAKILAPAAEAQAPTEIPTLAQLIDLLSQETLVPDGDHVR